MSDPSSRLAFLLVFAVRKKLRNTRGLSSFAKSKLSASFLCYATFPRVQVRNPARFKGVFQGGRCVKKYAGGIFLAIDRSGYAARNSVI